MAEGESPKPQPEIKNPMQEGIKKAGELVQEQSKQIIREAQKPQWDKLSELGKQNLDKVEQSKIGFKLGEITRDYHPDSIEMKKSAEITQNTGVDEFGLTEEDNKRIADMPDPLRGEQKKAA